MLATTRRCVTRSVTRGVRYSSSSTSANPQDTSTESESGQSAAPSDLAGAAATSPVQPPVHSGIIKKEAKLVRDYPTEKDCDKSKKRYLNSLPRVPTSTNISFNNLMIDVLMNNYRPLIEPLKKNHFPVETALLKRKKKTSVLQSLADFKATKKSLRESNNARYKNYNPYFSKQQHLVPYTSIFTNTILNTQQHSTELFNLPLSYLEKLKPFHPPSKPGEEFYRDDLIIVRNIELEEQELSRKANRKSKYLKDIESAKGKRKKPIKIEDIEEYFGFK